MKERFILKLICMLLLVLQLACTKDDNKPMPLSTISRLYVSNADTDASIVNTLIFDRADENKFPEPYKFNSELPDANGILFDPFSGTVFQVSRKNRNIRTFKVNTDGSLVLKESFIDEALLSARDIAFDRGRDLLYVSSDIDSAVYIYNSVSKLKGTVTASKKLKLNGRPRGMFLDENRLFIVIDQNRAEVQLFENASELLAGTINTEKKLVLSGAIRLHGITYSAQRDILLLTDIAEVSNAGFDTDGAIHFISGAMEKFKSPGTAIVPSKTIKGINTLLGNPTDIAWDERSDKDLIYVSEKAGKKILVFKYADTGNTAPSVKADLGSSPEAIYLDAR